MLLIVVGGLPATGKSTIAGALARELHAPFLRIDTIEQAIAGSSPLTHPLGPVGYVVGYALAGEQLRLGLDVIVECVNPLAVTRSAWREVAANAGADIIEVETVCSDTAVHRHRAETRSVDITGLPLPTWADIQARVYEPWDRGHLVLDTSVLSVAQALELIRNTF